MSSAFNEEENLEELHRRCRAVHTELAREFGDCFELRFHMLVADNGSEDGSLTVLLCSDLQDPPEVAGTMVRSLLEQPQHNAVLAVKTRSAGGPLLRLARRTYYRALGLSSWRAMVPSDYHVFGCYRQAVLEEAVRFWKGTDLNVRQCLTHASQAPLLIDYVQADRLRGASSYRG